MNFFLLEVYQGAQLIYKSVQGTRLNCVNDTMYYLRTNKIEPKINSSFHVSIKQTYFDQCGKMQTKYKGGKYSFHKHFSIHKNEFTFEVFETELINRFVKIDR